MQLNCCRRRAWVLTVGGMVPAFPSMSHAQYCDDRNGRVLGPRLCVLFEETAPRKLAAPSASCLGDLLLNPVCCPVSNKAAGPLTCQHSTADRSSGVQPAAKCLPPPPAAATLLPPSSSAAAAFFLEAARRCRSCVDWQLPGELLQSLPVSLGWHPSPDLLAAPGDEAQAEADPPPSPRAHAINLPAEKPDTDVCCTAAAMTLLAADLCKTCPTCPVVALETAPHGSSENHISSGS